MYQKSKQPLTNPSIPLQRDSNPRSFPINKTAKETPYAQPKGGSIPEEACKGQANSETMQYPSPTLVNVMGIRGLASASVGRNSPAKWTARLASYWLPEDFIAAWLLKLHMIATSWLPELCRSERSTVVVREATSLHLVSCG